MIENFAITAARLAPTQPQALASFAIGTLEPNMAKAGEESVTGAPLAGQGGRRASGNAPQNERRIGATEAEGVGEHRIDLALLRRVRDEVDRRFHRRVVEVEGRRRDVVADGER